MTIPEIRGQWSEISDAQRAQARLRNFQTRMRRRQWALLASLISLLVLAAAFFL